MGCCYTICFSQTNFDGDNAIRDWLAVNKVQIRDIEKKCNKKGGFHDKYYYKDGLKEMMDCDDAGKKYKAYVKGLDVPIIVTERPFKTAVLWHAWRKEFLRQKHMSGHPNILRCYDMVEQNQMFYAIEEYIVGVNLLSWIVDRTNYNESQVRIVMSGLLNAVEHLHANKLIHRNIRPESLFIWAPSANLSILSGDGKDEEGKEDKQDLKKEYSPESKMPGKEKLMTQRNTGHHLASFGGKPSAEGNGSGSSFSLMTVKLCDFRYMANCSRVTGIPLRTNEKGSMTYAAPEVLKSEPYALPSDMFSVGIIMFILLGGYHPFMGIDDNGTIRNIKCGSFTFDGDLSWNLITDEAKDLITKLLCVDPLQRITAKQAKLHPWFHKDRRHITENSKALNRSDDSVSVDEVGLSSPNKVTQ